MTERNVTISIRIPLSTIEKIDKMIEKHDFKNVTDASRRLIGLGIWMVEQRALAKDPEAAVKIRDELARVVKANAIWEWGETLDDSNLLGTIEALQYIRERRYKQDTLRNVQSVGF